MAIKQEHETVIKLAGDCDILGQKGALLSKAMKYEQKLVLAKCGFASIVGPLEPIVDSVGDIITLENDITKKQDFEGWAASDLQSEENEVIRAHAADNGDDDDEDNNEVDDDIDVA